MKHDVPFVCHVCAEQKDGHGLQTYHPEYNLVCSWKLWSGSGLVNILMGIPGAVFPFVSRFA